MRNYVNMNMQSEKKDSQLCRLLPFLKGQVKNVYWTFLVYALYRNFKKDTKNITNNSSTCSGVGDLKNWSWQMGRSLFNV